MKKATKRLLAVLLTFVMAVTLLAVPASGMNDVSAATEEVGINPYSTRIVSIVPGRYGPSGVISVTGTTKASDIKNLKSSNKDMKVSARAAASAYIHVEYTKPGKTTITFTVKGKKIKTTFTVKKYSNPFKTFKVGGKSYTSKFNKAKTVHTNKKISKKTLKVTAKKGWVITQVNVHNGYGSNASKYYRVNKTSFSKKITLNRQYAEVVVQLKQKSTGLYEYMYLAYDK